MAFIQVHELGEIAELTINSKHIIQFYKATSNRYETHLVLTRGSIELTTPYETLRKLLINLKD